MRLSRARTWSSRGYSGLAAQPEEQRVAVPITVNGQLESVDEFSNIILRATPDGAIVRLSDVARIEVGADTYQFGARLNSDPTAAFAISLTPDANALSTAAGVKQAMDELSEFFPSNIRYDVPYDTAPYVQVSIEQVAAHAG